MNQEHASNVTVAATIEELFDGRWAAWRSDSGKWWASRTQALTAAQLTAGSVPFLQAADPEELISLIREQERITPP